ncbi:tetratricopeptide repeat protein [Chryseobacterium viscerum]|nr:helix-turn-helix transcriptional regulator [Chryseobacterium viscerum]
MKMLKTAEKKGYQKGVIWGNINLATQYYNLAKPDLSLRHLNLAKKIADQISTDPETYAKIYSEFAQVYYTLGVFDISKRYNSKAIKYGETIKSSHYKKKFLSYLYNSRAGALIDTGSDSAIYYFHKSASLYENPGSYCGIAGCYTKKNNHLDSAKFYLDKADIILKKSKQVSSYRWAVLYLRYASLYSKYNRNKEVIKFLKKSLSYSSNGKNRQYLLEVYDLLAESYRKTGDIENQKNVLGVYKKFNESYKDAQAKSTQITIESLEKELSEKEDKRTFNRIAYSWAFILSGTVLFVIYRKRRNEKIFFSKEKSISENSNIQSLYKAPSSAIVFENLYNLAKDRDPNFIIQFQNLYPNFFKNILEINSKMQKNELHLLAYVYLNFTTKEIAEILFLSPKTIQNKKHSVRKKLNIKSSDDLYIWLEAFYQ